MTDRIHAHGVYRRTRLAARQIAVSLFLMCAGIAAAAAQNYPNHPLRVIVPFAPAGGVDVAARVFAEKLGTILGQPVVVENRSGAGGIQGAVAEAQSAPDGYTILFGGIATHGILPVLHKDLPYDPIKDFAPVIAYAGGPLVLVINPSVPAHSVAELIALAKTEPGKMSFGSAGVGSSIDLMGEMFKSMAGIDIKHVPYRGADPALLDVVAGYVQMTWAPYAPISEYLKAGRLRALGVTTAKRSTLLPELPPIIDTLPGYDAVSWYGIFVPAHTPQIIVTQLNRVIGDMLADKEFSQRLAALGLEPIGGSPADFVAFINRELQKWGKVVREAEITAP